MAERSDITPEVCRQLVRYDPETGKLWWLERGMAWFNDLRSCASWNAKYAGKEAFWVMTEDGYRKGLLLRRSVRASRLAWVLTHGAWPAGEIDHINGVKTDNRLANLRDVPRQINARNRSKRRDNRSGHTGIRRDLNTRKWLATIRGDGKNVYLGSYSRLKDAVEARRQAAASLGYTEGHGAVR